MAQDPGCSPGTPAYAEAALGSVSSSREDTRRGTAPEKPSPVCSGLPTTNTARAALRFYQPVTGTCKSCSGSSATRWARADGLSCTQLARSGLPQNSRGPVGSFACLACSAFLSFPGQQVLCCAARGHIPSHPIPLHPIPLSHPIPPQAPALSPPRCRMQQPQRQPGREQESPDAGCLELPRGLCSASTAGSSEHQLRPRSPRSHPDPLLEAPCPAERMAPAGR